VALTITNEASANDTVSGATLALTVTAAVGTLLMLGVAADNAGTAGAASLSSSVTDSAGNTWTNQSLLNRTNAGVASDGITLGIWTCMVTTALVAGTVTVNFSPSTASRAAIIKKVTPASGEMVLIAGVGAGATGGATTWDAPTVSVTNGDTIVGFTALEATSAGSGDSDTTNGNWSTAYTAVANTGTTGTSAGVGSQHKTVNATGNQTYGSTNASARDFAINYIVLSPLTVTLGAAGVGAASFAATAPAVGTFAAAGVGAATFIATRSRTGLLRATGRGSVRWIGATPKAAGPRLRSLRILVRVDWADGEIETTRLWDGGGPWVDADGNVWLGAGSFGDLDEIEQAINGEAATLNMTLSGVGSAESDLVWLAYTDDEVIGSVVTIQLQPCDADDQPVGSPETRFTGTIDDISFRDAVVDKRRVSTIEVAVVNKFTVRRLASGAVLSDADQKARSAILNPEAEPDLFCERVPQMLDRSITWPRWS